jgi:hypothetical protein
VFRRQTSVFQHMPETHVATCACSPWRYKVVRDLAWVMGSPHLLQPHVDLTPVLPDGLSTSLVRLCF